VKTRLVTLVLAVLLPHVALADAGLVTRSSKYSVAETMDRFETAVKNAPERTRIFARIDLQALAASPGSKVRPRNL